MKKKYNAPLYEVEKFVISDVFTTSGAGGGDITGEVTNPDNIAPEW